MTREEAIQILEEEANYLYNDDEPYCRQAFDMAIEALKGGDAEMTGTPSYMQQSPSDGADLISREDAIAYIDRIINSGLGRNKSLDYIHKYISALPSTDRPHGEWKLASEELPKSVGSYLVTCEGEYGFIYADYDFWTVSDEFKYHHDNVIAWMTFPKPYYSNCGVRMKGSDLK